MQLTNNHAPPPFPAFYFLVNLHFLLRVAVVDLCLGLVLVQVQVQPNIVWYVKGLDFDQKKERDLTVPFAMPIWELWPCLN